MGAGSHRRATLQIQSPDAGRTASPRTGRMRHLLHCRKPDINCFMMACERRAGTDTWLGGVRSGSRPHISYHAPCSSSGCDNCNEWFHGDCIRITEKMAKAIRGVVLS